MCACLPGNRVNANVFKGTSSVFELTKKIALQPPTPALAIQALNALHLIVRAHARALYKSELLQLMHGQT